MSLMPVLDMYICRYEKVYNLDSKRNYRSFVSGTSFVADALHRADGEDEEGTVR